MGEDYVRIACGLTAAIVAARHSSQPGNDGPAGMKKNVSLWPCDKMRRG